MGYKGGGNAAEWRVKNMANLHETQYFGRLEKEPENEAKRILMAVSNALREKGYNPVNQIAISFPVTRLISQAIRMPVC